MDKTPLNPYGRKAFGAMKELLLPLVIVGGWFLLQIYILPKLGVST